MRRMPQPFDSSDIPVVTYHQQGDYITTEMPYKPNNYTLHPMSMPDLGIQLLTKHKPILCDRFGVISRAHAEIRTNASVNDAR